MKYEMNLNWTCNGKAVDLPHDAMLEERRDASCRNGVNSGYFPGGKYTYEKTFEINSEDRDKKIVLHFEGVYQNCTVSVNGKQAGAHKYGYTAFDVDISDAVQAGENRLRVDVDNSLEPNCRWYSGSGIYRPVSLLIDELDAPKIITKSYEPVVIQVTADADAVEILDGETVVAS
ncbi:MAG: glycoside hydrolase family 2, partial [bacterium]|nr:glycoside hydrolase family 2 [bacterium]